MSDEQWVFKERFILAIRAPSGRKPLTHHLVLYGLFWIAGWFGRARPAGRVRQVVARLSQVPALDPRQALGADRARAERDWVGPRGPSYGRQHLGARPIIRQRAQKEGLRDRFFAPQGRQLGKRSTAASTARACPLGRKSRRDRRRIVFGSNWSGPTRCQSPVSSEMIGAMPLTTFAKPNKRSTLCLRACHPPSLRNFIPVLSTSRFSGPSARRYGIRTASDFRLWHGSYNPAQFSPGQPSSVGWTPSRSSA